MSSEDLERVEAVFQAALDLPPERRAGYLGEVCAGDAELRSEVVALVLAYEQSENFIERPAMEIDAAIVASSLAGTLLGQTISHYRMIERLGEGGMGEVYLAQDTRLGRRIALKLLPARFTIDGDRVHRFEQEARSASALNHPNIVTIHEVGEAGAVHFIATEFIEGVTLREHLRSRRMNLSEVLEVATQVASALAAAHEAGIVHRDIKPENIMLRRDGYVKVLDFGLAKLAISETAALGNELLADSSLKTDPGMVMGTVNYMSPEQARGLAVDARTDIWSFGVLFYEMLAGKTPFAGETPSHSIVATLDREPPPLSEYLSPVPPRLERIVAQTLRKSKEGRYRTGNDLLLDLQSLKHELEVNGRPDHVRLTAPPRTDTESATNESEIADENQSAQRALPLDSAHRTSSAAYFVGEIRRHRRGLILALAVVLIAVVTVIAFLPRASFWPWGQTPKAGAPFRINSIAVLPFTYAGTDSADENLGFTMADTLISRLKNLREITVLSAVAVRKFAAANRDPAAAGRELKVDAVLDASMHHENQRIRIDLRLVNSADGATLWTGEENELIDSVTATQDRVVDRVALALGPYLNVLTKRYVQNSEAYRLYMNGRYHWTQNTRQDLEKSLDYFNKAIEKDPNYAPAYAGIADLYTSIVADPLPKDETIPKARQAVTKALALDDNLADAHVSLARIRAYYDWDWSGAESEFRRAIELEPNSGLAHGEFGSWLAGMGRSDEAILETKQALDLDPLSLHNNFYLVWALLSAHRYDEVIAHSRLVLPTFTQAHTWMGWGYLGKGMNAEAITEFEKRLSLQPDVITKSNLGYAYGITARTAEAEKTVAELKESYEQRKVSAYFVAFTYAGLGDKDQTFVWLERAYQDHSRSLWGLKANPGWDTVRTDPRFANLMQRLRLE